MPDFSSLPVTAFPETKHVLEPKLKRLREPPGYRSAIVCKSAHCEMVTDFWQAYVERDPEYPSHPVFFSRLKDACDWLELPEAGCEAIRAQHAQLAPLPSPSAPAARTARRSASAVAPTGTHSLFPPCGGRAPAYRSRQRRSMRGG